MLCVAARRAHRGSRVQCPYATPCAAHQHTTLHSPRMLIWKLSNPATAPTLNVRLQQVVEQYYELLVLGDGNRSCLGKVVSAQLLHFEIRKNPSIKMQCKVTKYHTSYLLSE